MLTTRRSSQSPFGSRWTKPTTRHVCYVPHMTTTPKPQYPRISRAAWVLLAIAVLVVGFLAFGAMANPYPRMSCEELRQSALKMTGADATEAYDVDKAKRINHEAVRRHCAYLFDDKAGPA